MWHHCHNRRQLLTIQFISTKLLPVSVKSEHYRSITTPSLPIHNPKTWRSNWQPTPVFLPGESQGRGSLVGCRLWGRTESDTTEATLAAAAATKKHIKSLGKWHMHTNKILIFNNKTVYLHFWKKNKWHLWKINQILFVWDPFPI